MPPRGTQSRQAFVTAAGALPDRSFADGETARELFEGAGAPRYREHAEQIRDWPTREGS